MLVHGFEKELEHVAGRQLAQQRLLQDFFRVGQHVGQVLAWAAKQEILSRKPLKKESESGIKKSRARGAREQMAACKIAPSNVGRPPRERFFRPLPVLRENSTILKKTVLLTEDRTLSVSNVVHASRRIALAQMRERRDSRSCASST